MISPTRAEALPGYRLFLEFDDGASGEVDLSSLAGHGVFELWLVPGAFERAHLTPYRAVAWSDEVELCADALYQRLTGRAVVLDPVALAS